MRQWISCFSTLWYIVLWSLLSFCIIWELFREISFTVKLITKLAVFTEIFSKTLDTKNFVNSIVCDNSSQCGKARNLLSPKQGRRSQRKSARAKGGTFFWSGFLLHFWAIWKNDPFSKFQKVPGLKPWLPRLVRRPCTEIIFCQINHLFSNFFNKNVAFTTFFVKV